MVSPEEGNLNIRSGPRHKNYLVLLLNKIGDLLIRGISSWLAHLMRWRARFLHFPTVVHLCRPLGSGVRG